MLQIQSQFTHAVELSVPSYWQGVLNISKTYSLPEEERSKLFLRVSLKLNALFK